MTMSISSLFLWALAWGFTTALSVAEPLAPVVVTRNAPGTSSADTVQAIARGLSSLQVQGRDTVIKNTTSLDKSWNSAVLFQFKREVKPTTSQGNLSVSGDVEIVCTTCYIKCNATVELNIAGGFNASKALKTLTDDASQVAQEVKNVTGTAFKAIAKNITDGDFHLSELDDLDFPTIDLDFTNISIPDIPEVMLRFQFDQMELYMEIDVTLDLDATYEVNLYKSESPIGLGAGQDINVGVIFDVDLILDVNAKIDVSSGFHLKLNDGAAIEIALFGQDVSHIALHGGQFEFLPVTVESAGAVMTAILRVGLHAGVEVGEPGFSLPGPLQGLSIPASSAGMEVGVFAHLANFVSNISVAAPEDKAGCGLKVVEYYELGLGAAAGATLAIGSHTWGPNPGTTVAVFYTTLAEKCAIQKPASPTSTVTGSTATKKARRAGLTTTTISTKVTYSGIGCMSTGLANCPVSLQTTGQITTTSTLVTAVPSGVSATFPATTQSSVASTVPFGKDAKDVLSSAGIPSSFIPPLPTTTLTPSSVATAVSGFIQGETGGVPNAAIIGASVGGAVVLITAIILGVRCWRRRQRYATVPSPPSMVYEPYEPMRQSQQYESLRQPKPTLVVTVT